MILLDTCALIFDALSPKKLTARAKMAIDQAEQQNKLFCCDISLWEIAMLVQKNRLNPGIDTQGFLQLLLNARKIQCYSIIPEIAALSCNPDIFHHADPADRIIGATAIHYQMKLITTDKKLSSISLLEVIC